MKYSSSLAILVPITLAQNVTVPTTCTGNFSAGSDEVLFTVPYTYTQVLSIIGNYSNLTWSGSPANSVTLNGTDNTVGTARTYDLQGAHVVETILEYSKPPAPGPYVEVHNTAQLTFAGVEVYIPFDGTVVTSVCDGRASMFNFTANFCATNATLAGGLLHQLHLGDAETVGKFLGGQNFTDCAALGASNGTGPANATSTAPSGSMSSPATFTGGSARQGLGIMGGATIAVLMYGIFY